MREKKMQEEDIHVLHGPKPYVSFEEGTAGQQLYKALLRHAHLPEAMINVHTQERISYRTFLENTCRLAQSFERWGLTKNSVISVCSENNLQFFQPVIAALYLGIITAPLNENYTERELYNALEISKPQIIFCSRRSLGKVQELKQKFAFVQKVILLDSEEDIGQVEALPNFILRYSDVNFDVNNFKPASFDRDDQVALIMCSSGTTGLPKGVMTTHKNLIVRFAHTRDPVFGTVSELGVPVLSFMPFFHGFGMVTNLGFFLLGLQIVVMQRFEPDLFLRTIQDYKIQSVLLVPPLLVFMAKSPIVDKYDLSSLKEIGCGAAPLAKELADAVAKRLNLKGVRQAYGLTESTLAVTMTIEDDYKPGSSGKVVPFISAKVVNPDTGKSLGPNQRGELCFKGDMVMKGYAGNPKATKETIDNDGWLHTGDIGYYDEDGHFYIVDRLKELIKYKGFQVPPAELEAILLTHPSIKDVGVAGIPDEVAGELPAALVVLQPGKKLKEQEVLDFVASQVSSAKLLRGGVQFVDQIPKSATGKIIRKEVLRQLQLLQPQKSKL